MWQWAIIRRGWGFSAWGLHQNANASWLRDSSLAETPWRAPSSVAVQLDLQILGHS
jgi:hypothetical protein